MMMAWYKEDETQKNWSPITKKLKTERSKKQIKTHKRLKKHKHLPLQCHIDEPDT